MIVVVIRLNSEMQLNPRASSSIQKEQKRESFQRITRRDIHRVLLIELPVLLSAAGRGDSAAQKRTAELKQRIGFLRRSDGRD